MGNSEVGHLNLGAGKVVFQDTTKITRAIADGSLRMHDSGTFVTLTAKGTNPTDLV